MCYIEACGKFHSTCADSASSGGVILMKNGSTQYTLILIGHTLNFIDSWLQSFEGKYYKQTMIYRDKTSDFFNKVNVTIP